MLVIWEIQIFLKTVPNFFLKSDNQMYLEQGLTEFQEDFSSIVATGAQWVFNRGIHLIDIDYLSIHRFHDGPETHQILLQNGVVIVETLILEYVEAGWCLPIKQEGLEGSPIRAVLKKY